MPLLLPESSSRSSFRPGLGSEGGAPQILPSRLRPSGEREKGYQKVKMRPHWP